MILQSNIFESNKLKSTATIDYSLQKFCMLSLSMQYKTQLEVHENQDYIQKSLK